MRKLAPLAAVAAASLTLAACGGSGDPGDADGEQVITGPQIRSEERRVGKECRL